MSLKTQENLNMVDAQLAQVLCREDLKHEWPNITELINQRRKLAASVERKQRKKGDLPTPASYKDTIRLVEAIVKEFKACVDENCLDEKARNLVLLDAHKRITSLLLDGM